MPLIERIMEAVQKIIDQALGINLLDMIVQIAATLILVLIVKKFFWGRITDFLEQRKNILETEMESAKKNNLEAEELKLKRQEEANRLKQEAKAYLDNAREKGDLEKERIIGEAKHNAKNIIERTNKEIEAEKIKAKSELRSETIELAALMAGKIIQKEVDEKKYQDLLVEDIERSEQS